MLVSARKFPDLGAGGGELPEVPMLATVARPLFLPELDTNEGLIELPPRSADAA